MSFHNVAINTAMLFTLIQVIYTLIFLNSVFGVPSSVGVYGFYLLPVLGIMLTLVMAAKLSFLAVFTWT